MNEMERMLSQYQEKLDNVTTSYEEKVNILENRLVDREMEQQPQPPDGQGGDYNTQSIRISIFLHRKYVSLTMTLLKTTTNFKQMLAC